MKINGKKTYIGSVVVGLIGTSLLITGIALQDIYLGTHGISLLAFAITLAALRDAIRKLEK